MPRAPAACWRTLASGRDWPTDRLTDSELPVDGNSGLWVTEFVNALKVRRALAVFVGLAIGDGRVREPRPRVGHTLELLERELALVV